jgi:uncharacterized protein DUF402
VRIVPSRSHLVPPGEAVVLRQLFRGRLWNAVPAVVVKDTAEGTALWLPRGTTYLIGDDLFADWHLHERVLGTGQLRISRAHQPYSVHLFRHADGSFRGWYVNLERPQQRDALGFAFEDELLDIWVENGQEPKWLDEDELEEAVRRGFFSPEHAAEIRANGLRLLADPPWPTGWEDWEPEPGWQQPTLPPGFPELLP